ncbi:hypothetical protein H072_3705 [Dactylellina haptotyla CBS 200.50]|uniref:Attractin/MKLN-like beta-propeller domain-containing protein n=1 Tax=Dactylellina haptotyla (strain CBS 200.50) TaxID=1284197 RepID=S8AMN1_DACHA|nr:hypothetical protein H072_3705 [Dactylellina haptotyla CBS 200.50]
MAPESRRRVRIPNPARLSLGALTILLPTVSTAAATAPKSAPISSNPIPASIFQTWTSAGNPLLHIQPAFHHANTTASLINFKSFFLADPGEESGIIDVNFLSDSSFSQDINGVQIPNLQLSSSKSILFFSRDARIGLLNDSSSDGGNSSNSTNTTVRDDTGELWAVTYPAYCRDIDKNATLSDYEILRSGPGKQGWDELSLEMQQRNISLWFPAQRYLGRGFAVHSPTEQDKQSSTSLLTGNQRLYSFGGMCLGGNGYSGNGKNDSFSSDVWKFENTTLGGVDAAAKRQKVVDVSIAISKNPPIPEAGFSMTPLTVEGKAGNNKTTTNETDSLEGMLILGGYTSQSRFVGLGQLAIYSLENEGWSFVSATLKQGDITARAGHSAVLDEDGKKIVVFGGWVGNVTRPATPYMLSLKVGTLDDDWEWEALNATEEVPGSGPGNMSLWGHAATVLEGNVMLITSGFQVAEFDGSLQQQVINDKTFLLNLTSNTWIQKYKYPMEILSKTAIEEGKKKTKRDIGILAGVFGGVLVLIIALAVLFYYARRQEEYADLPNETLSTDRDKFHSLDLEYGKDLVVMDGNTPFTIVRRGTEDNGRLLHPESPGSPELPPRPPAPLRMHRSQPSHVDMERIENMRAEQEQRENLFQESALERRRSVRSEMVAWVREWANADAAAQAAEVMKRSREDSTASRWRKESTTLGNSDRYLKPGRQMSTVPGGGNGDAGRCITSSSQYSDGQVSTLTASEVYDTPVEEVPYPVPPILLSTAQSYKDQSPRNPRVLVGPKGVTAPLPSKMAEEFPDPTLVPRDSIASSAYEGNYNHLSYGSSQPLLQYQRKESVHPEDWETVAPESREGSAWAMVDQQPSLFSTIPLATFEETRTIKKAKSLEDRIREEMYNPGPMRTEDECRLSSIMDYYADSLSPTPIPEVAEEDDYEDEGDHVSLVGGVQTSTYAGERAILSEKAKMVSTSNQGVEEPIEVGPIREQQYNPKQQPSSSRVSTVGPLLSETLAAQARQGKGDGKSAVSTRSRIPSLGSSIKRRAVAMAATLSPHSHQGSEKRSTSLGRKSVLHRRPQTAKAPSSASDNLPQQAEIMNVNDRATEILFTKGLTNYDSDMDIDDKVVQMVYTAPKGKLRVVNPGPRRISSGGTTTDGSLGLFQQYHAQRRVSSSGNYPVMSTGEGILRLGSAAARRVGELD